MSTPVTFTKKQLNYFKFISVVADEFTKALRQTFIAMWDNKYGTTPGYQPWDDSVAVRTMFRTLEGKRDVPPSIEEWDCTELFQAIIYSHTFSVALPGGRTKTLNQMYVAPKRLPSGSFYPIVAGANQEETIALSVDQLRRLRNTASHSSSTKEIDKASFDNFVQLTKDAFKALGLTTAVVDNVGALTEDDFPTGRVRTLENTMLHFLRNETLEGINDIKEGNKNIQEISENIQEGSKAILDKSKDILETNKDILQNYATSKDTKTIVYQVGDIKDSLATIARCTEGLNDIQDASEDIQKTSKDVLRNVVAAQKQIKAIKKQVEDVKDTVMKKLDTIAAESKTATSCHQSNLPPRVPHFVGREKEINEAIEHLTQNDTRVMTVWGSGGFGKSSLAIELGHHLKEKGVITIFASMKTIDKSETFVSKLLYFFETRSLERLNDIKARELLCNHFREISDPCILILDNIDDLLSRDRKEKNEFLDTITALIQSNPKLRIICTSRENMSYYAHKTPAYSLKLAGLKTIDSVKLLQELLTGKGSQQECGKLAKLFLNIPLALILASSLICEDSVEILDLIEEIEEYNSNIFDVTDKPDNPDDMRLRTLIEYSYARLSPEYQWMFTSLLVFPGSFDVKAAASVLKADKILTVKKDMGVLQRKSLVEFDIQTKRYSLHDFMKAFLQIKQREDDESTRNVKLARLKFFDYYLSLIESINDKFLSGKALSALKEFQRDQENITFCLTEAVRNDEKHERAVGILLELDIFLDTVFWYNRYTHVAFYDNCFAECKNRKETIYFSQLQVSKSFGVLHWPSNEADWLLSEANTSQEQSESVPAEVRGKWLCYYGFRKLYISQQQEGLSRLEEGFPMLGSTQSDMVTKVLALRVLTEYYRANNRTSLAATCTERALSCCLNDVMKFVLLFPSTKFVEKMLVIEESKPLLSLLFFYLVKLTIKIGCKERAETVVKALLSILENTSTELTRDAIGDYKSELDCYTKVLHMKEKALGDHESTAWSLDQIGKMHYMLEDYDNALDAYKSCLAMRQQVLGEHKDTARTYEDLGDTYSKLGDYTSALEAHQRALVMREKVLGDHEDTAQSHLLIGSTYFDLGDYKNALDALKRALFMRQQVLGEHESTACSLDRIAAMHVLLKDYDNALDAYKSCLAMRQQVLGEHKDTAGTYEDLGDTYDQIGDYTSALEAHKNALVMREKVLGDHEDTAQSWRSRVCW